MEKKPKIWRKKRKINIFSFFLDMRVGWEDCCSVEGYKIARNKHTHKYMMIIIVYAASWWRHCFKVHGRKILFDFILLLLLYQASRNGIFVGWKINEF